MSCRIRRWFECLCSSSNCRVVELQVLVKKVAAMHMKGFQRELMNYTKEL